MNTENDYKSINKTRLHLPDSDTEGLVVTHKDAIDFLKKLDKMFQIQNQIEYVEFEYIINQLKQCEVFKEHYECEDGYGSTGKCIGKFDNNFLVHLSDENGTYYQLWNKIKPIQEPLQFEEWMEQEHGEVLEKRRSEYDQYLNDFQKENTEQNV